VCRTKFRMRSPDHTLGSPRSGTQQPTDNFPQMFEPDSDAPGCSKEAVVVVKVCGSFETGEVLNCLCGYGYANALCGSL